MATDYKTPGVYVEEIPKLPPSIAQVETAIPAFLGYTEKAKNSRGEDLTNKPSRITSLLEYESMFGGPQPEVNLEITLTQTTDGSGKVISEVMKVDFADKASKHTMYYNLQAYFANGGGPCYIISVGAFKANVGDDLDKADYTKGMAALEKEDEPTLIVFPEGQNMDEGDYYDLQNTSLDLCGKMQDRFAIIDIHDDAVEDLSEGEVKTVITDARDKITSSNLKYGAAYFPNIKSGFAYKADESKVNIKHTVDGGNGALNSNKLDTLQASNSADYNKLKGALNRFGITLPPSSYVAGVYAAVDNSRGVWKAPANVGLIAARGLAYKVTNNLQDDLNVDATSGKSVNCIRAFTGKGILVWGARTLAGNDNEWRYVSVRRFFNMVEESTKKATEPFVFEPNDANTWVKVQAMIENYLTNLWRQGALQGAKPEHAFYVAVGLGKTMTAIDILEGRMIVEIGMAAVRPAEFIILRFSHKMAES
jgi:phage tail sheath protein FI